MNTKTAITGNSIRAGGYYEPVRTTALLYLEEALNEERYEECSEILDIAYEFGAAKKDVDRLISVSLTRIRLLS